MNEFERRTLKKMMEDVNYTERLRKLMREADPLGELVGHQTVAAMRETMRLQDEQARLERLYCLARGASADYLASSPDMRATDYANSQAERHIAEYEAAFRKNNWDSWVQDEIQKQLDQSAWIANLAGPAGLEHVKRTLEERQYPWVSEFDATASVRGFVELQVLGGALNTRRPFADDITLATREVLGDWTGVTKMPAEIFTDALARSTFYLDHGYDSSVADFPARTFHENLRYAGFDKAAPASDAETEEDAAKRRTVQAQELLGEFERELRQFIVAKLTACAGSKWIKQRVDGSVLLKWRERQQIDRNKRGAELPLIEYVDFSEYERILTRVDNWNEAFQAHFEREQSVRESLLRLAPLRNAASHARLLTQDDWVFLEVEVRRLRIAISRTPIVDAEDDHDESA